MKKNKLIVVIMGQNCEKFIGMCLESVKLADAIVYCDGGSEDKTLEIVNRKFVIWNKIDGRFFHIIKNKYKQEDKAMNGRQRNFYLRYISENYPDCWCLVLDADEVVEDLSKIKEFIQEAKYGLYSVKMRHFIGDLGHEDATQQEHYAINRLFEIKGASHYPEVEHPVLIPKEGYEQFIFKATLIWHLAYCSACWDYMKRYKNHLKKSNMHTPEFLKNWYYAHLFGQYPKNQINIMDIPEIILREFEIDRDEFYFKNRGLNLNNFLMVKQWTDWFREKRNVPKGHKIKILDIGCGLGNYGFVADYIGEEWEGLELSKFAVENNPYKLNIKQGNIVKEEFIDNKYDMVWVIDILEHLEENELERVLKNISKTGDYYIFSIPFLGDPNLEADKTHKIKQSKEWWTERLSKYFKLEEVPNWLFKEQIVLGKSQ